MVTESKISWKWMKGNSNGSNSSKCTGEKRRENPDCSKKVVFDTKKPKFMVWRRPCFKGY